MGFITFTSLNPTSCLSAWRVSSSGVGPLTGLFIVHISAPLLSVSYTLKPVLCEFMAYLILSSLYLGRLGLLRSLLGMTVLPGSSKPCPSECLLLPSTVVALTASHAGGQRHGLFKKSTFLNHQKICCFCRQMVTGYGMVLREGLPRQPGCCYCNDDVTQWHFSVHPTFAL